MDTSTTRGSVLLLALLIMTTVIISSVGLSSLILSSLQQSRVIDNSVVAYYAAESAIEEALYQVMVVEGGAQGSEGVFGNGAAWARTVSTGDAAIFATIPKDDFIEVSLYDPLAPIAMTDIAYVSVWWSDECGGCSAVQASLVGWAPGDSVLWDTGSDAQTVRRSVSAEQPLTISLGDPNRLYRLRLRAMFGTLKNVEVRAFTAGDVGTDIPGRIRIDARGDFIDSQQRISVTLPQREPALGLLDFVVYSECSIVKGGPATCGTP